MESTPKNLYVLEDTLAMIKPITADAHTENILAVIGIDRSQPKYRPHKFSSSKKELYRLLISSKIIVPQ
jgi:hypothetical protein